MNTVILLININNNHNKKVPLGYERVYRSVIEHYPVPVIGDQTLCMVLWNLFIFEIAIGIFCYYDQFADWNLAS